MNIKFSFNLMIVFGLLMCRYICHEARVIFINMIGLFLKLNNKYSLFVSEMIKMTLLPWSPAHHPSYRAPHTRQPPLAIPMRGRPPTALSVRGGNVSVRGTHVRLPSCSARGSRKVAAACREHGWGHVSPACRLTAVLFFLF